MTNLNLGFSIYFSFFKGRDDKRRCRRNSLFSYFMTKLSLFSCEFKDSHEFRKLTTIKGAKIRSKVPEKIFLIAWNLIPTLADGLCGDHGSSNRFFGKLYHRIDNTYFSLLEVTFFNFTFQLLLIWKFGLEKICSPNLGVPRPIIILIII